MQKILWLIFLIFPIALKAEMIDTPLGKVEITQMASGLNEPWSLAFLPQGYLVTLRGGQLIWVHDGQSAIIKNTPASQQGGQGGYFDVLVPSDFSQNQEIYLSYAKSDGRGTAVHAATLDLVNQQLTNGRDIFVMNSPTRSELHFGGRLVEDGDALFLTLGERGDRFLAQNPEFDNGSVVRIKRDGSGYQTISKGHRNPQGAAKDARGVLFINEHGAKGGDELNEIEAGKNYGWPIISYGVNYDGTKIGEGFAKEGMEQPEYYWDPSIAPSGMAIHSGRGWPAAKGLFFIGSLKFDHIAVLKPGSPFQEIGEISSVHTGRVRDVREAPDGSIWFLSVDNQALYRLAPAL